MLTALVAVTFYKAALTAADISNGGKLLTCIYPSIEKVPIACSTDGSALISIDAIQATRVSQAGLTCIQQKARNNSALSQCTYGLNNSMFYYQFQYPRCNLKPSCIINGELPSAIVILGYENCTSNANGRERDAVIIRWSCVALDDPGSQIPALTTTAWVNAIPVLTTTATATSSVGPQSQSNSLSNMNIGLIAGCIVFVVAISATVTLLLKARNGRLRGWTAALKRYCCLRRGVATAGGGFDVRRSAHHAAQLQPAVLVIDKRGNLSSAPQASIHKREKVKSSVQRERTEMEVDSSQPTDMEVEVDANDDYQKFSSGDLLEICEEEPAAAAAAAAPEKTDAAVGDESLAGRLSEWAAKPLQRGKSLPHSPTAAAAAAAAADSAELAAAGAPFVKASLPANASDPSKHERGDKKSRRRQYEVKWNARYQDTTETETDDRRPPPLPPSYVLDPDSQAFQLPGLPSPADSSDE